MITIIKENGITFKELVQNILRIFVKSVRNVQESF